MLRSVAYTDSVPVKIGPARLGEFVEEMIRSDAAIRADGLALFSYHPGVDGDDQARTVAGREVHQRPDHLGEEHDAERSHKHCDLSVWWW